MSRPAYLAAVLVATLGCGHGTASCPQLTARKAPSSTVGFRSFDAIDPLTRGPLPVGVFYPTASATRAGVAMGPYCVAAAPAAPPAAGRMPLVVISHGHAGSMLGQHDLAEALARHGYVVAAVEHVGDSWRDQSASGSDRALLGRAYQISALIDAVLNDPTIGPHVDRARIGVAGFCAGGYTSLLLVGAQPDFTRVRVYCEHHPLDPEICGKTLQIRMDSPPPTADGRVRAAFVMAPFAIVFGPSAFETVSAPVFLAWAANDHVLLPSENAEPVGRALHTLVGTRRIEGADHFVFLSPCSRELTSEAPELCKDAKGVDRASVHAQLIRDAEQFFDQSL
jgi:predicted dienelactone hydrolase